MLLEELNIFRGQGLEEDTIEALIIDIENGTLLSEASFRYQKYVEAIEKHDNE